MIQFFYENDLCRCVHPMFALETRSACPRARILDNDNGCIHSAVATVAAGGCGEVRARAQTTHCSQLAEYKSILRPLHNLQPRSCPQFLLFMESGL